MLDFGVEVLALLVLVVVDAIAAQATTPVVAALVITEIVLVLAGYRSCCEWLTRGRTLGQRRAGSPAADDAVRSLCQALARGLAGLLIEKPACSPR